MENLPKDILVELVKIIKNNAMKEYCHASSNKQQVNKFVMTRNPHGLVEVVGVLKSGSDNEIRNLTYVEKLICFKNGWMNKPDEINYYKFSKRELLYIIVNSQKFSS